jgi:hypothetical protein
MEELISETPVVSSKKKKSTTPKEPKVPKRDDFDIFRTIFQRTTQRRIPYILRNLGADHDLYFMSSSSEESFTYGASDHTIAMIKITDPVLQETVDKYMSKIYGMSHDEEQSLVVNIRDQISALGKTKGESFEDEVITDKYGGAYTRKFNKVGREVITRYSLAIDSLYHFQMVRAWCAMYRPYLEPRETDKVMALKHNDEENTIPVEVKFAEDDSFTCSPRLTRGVDTIYTKDMEKLPHPVIREELLVVHDSGSAYRLLHRVIGEGWSMVLLRPNAVYIAPMKKDQME